MHDELRRACRITAGREPEPTAAVIDSQSVKAAETVAAASRGFDAGKKVQGRKRRIAVDVIGLLLTVVSWTGPRYTACWRRSRCSASTSSRSASSCRNANHRNQVTAGHRDGR